MQAIQNRLKRIEGQIRGLQKLLETSPDNCEQVITQFKATQSALDNCFSALLSKNLQQCVKEKDKATMEKVLKLIVK